jgi:hypothetical protein
MNRLLSSGLLVILTLSPLDLGWSQPTDPVTTDPVATGAQLFSRVGSVPTITVAIYDDLHLSARILVDAQGEAMRIYRKAGVTISWIVCKSSTMEVDLRCQDSTSATHLNLRIVPHASKASDGIFGVAFLSAEGTGAYSDISYDSVEELNRDWHVGVARVLGHVMAHELGHLLLGSNAHSRQGIMCPRWHGVELHQASTGSLLFSEEQARLMRARLAH